MITQDVEATTMTRAIIVLSTALSIAAGSSFAQSPQPYAGMQARPL